MRGVRRCSRRFVPHRGRLFRGGAWSNARGAQTYVNGSVCDLTGAQREASVRFACGQGKEARLVSVRERATCSYRLVVIAPQLCAHPAFQVGAGCAAGSGRLDPAPPAPLALGAGRGRGRGKGEEGRSAVHRLRGEGHAERSGAPHRRDGPRAKRGRRRRVSRALTFAGDEDRRRPPRARATPPPPQKGREGAPRASLRPRRRRVFKGRRVGTPLWGGAHAARRRRSHVPCRVGGVLHA